MNIRILIVLLTLSVNLYSQKGFYLSPRIEHKWHMNNETPFTIITSQGYKMEIEPLQFYGGNWFELGLYFGYKAENWAFITGLSGDQGNNGFKLRAWEWNPGTKGYNFVELRETGGASLYKIPIRIMYKIGQRTREGSNTKILDLTLLGGIDFLLRPRIPPISGNSYQFVVDSSLNVLSYQSLATSQTTRAFLSSVGLTLNIYNKRGQALFSISSNFSMGLFKSQTAFTQLLFTNYDGINYNAVLTSKSSGFYMTLSKDIYFSKLFKRASKSDLK